MVCSWLGNTEAVAKKNYLLVTDADFAKATETRGTPDARADQKTERRGTKTTLQTIPLPKKKPCESQGKAMFSVESTGFSEGGGGN